MPAKGDRLRSYLKRAGDEGQFTDVDFSFSDEAGGVLSAHRAVLAHESEALAALVTADAEGQAIPVPSQFSRDTFERAFECIYTGSLEGGPPTDEMIKQLTDFSVYFASPQPMSAAFDSLSSTVDEDNCLGILLCCLAQKKDEKLWTHIQTKALKIIDACTSLVAKDADLFCGRIASIEDGGDGGDLGKETCWPFRLSDCNVDFFEVVFRKIPDTDGANTRRLALQHFLSRHCEF